MIELIALAGAAWVASALLGGGKSEHTGDVHIATTNTTEHHTTVNKTEHHVAEHHHHHAAPPPQIVEQPASSAPTPAPIIVVVAAPGGGYAPTPGQALPEHVQPVLEQVNDGQWDGGAGDVIEGSWRPADRPRLTTSARQVTGGTGMRRLESRSILRRR